MKKKISLKLIDRILFLVILFSVFAGLINIILDCKDNIIYKTLPFKLRGNTIIDVADKSDYKYLDWSIIKIDTLDVDMSIIKIEGEDTTEIVKYLKPIGQIFVNYIVPHIIKNKGTSNLIIENHDATERTTINIENINTLNIPFFGKTLILIILYFFVIFNSILLLLYSKQWENRLIILFLLALFLPIAKTLFPPAYINLWQGTFSPFWGLFFYHFISLKIDKKINIRKLYIITIVLLFLSFLIGGWGLNNSIAFVWAIFWFIKGYLLLKNNVKNDKTNLPLKRLFAAFKGIQISLISVLTFLICMFLVGLLTGIFFAAGSGGIVENNMSALLIVILLIVFLPTISFFLGIIWFLGSFTWSLLTGTVMDVSIRSTLIYSMVGVIFVIIFGMADYMLGELLQNIFGNFIGSEFIAGIPATISLLLFFNPLRNRIEGFVDKKLNSTELQFLENTDTFTKNLSEEGVLEGFEEYICDNLYDKLSLNKIALIAFDQQKETYRFNEIRGSDVIENSLVEDKFSYLSVNDVVRINKLKSSVAQDISSFQLLIPIINECDIKWWLALGTRIDDLPYTKNDIEALIKLTDQIKLSLKFILIYEDIVEKKILRKIAEKDDQIRLKDQKISKLISSLSVVEIKN